MRALRMGLSLAAVSLLFCGASRGAEHTKDSLEKVREQVKEKKAILVDVREESEWKQGHIAGATHLPLSWLAKDPDAKELQKKLPKGKILYIHCRSGGRCLIAADLLEDSGYDLRPLKPGYANLLKAGFPKSDEKKAAAKTDEKD